MLPFVKRAISRSILINLGKQNSDMNLNTEADKKNTYDAIVVGTGISGGMAAKRVNGEGI